MKEFIETNYEGSEVVSSEYTKMCEDVLNLYKKIRERNRRKVYGRIL